MNYYYLYNNKNQMTDKKTLEEKPAPKKRGRKPKNKNIENISLSNDGDKVLVHNDDMNNNMNIDNNDNIDKNIIDNNDVDENNDLLDDNNDLLDENNDLLDDNNDLLDDNNDLLYDNKIMMN